jgi:hypothetical protein
LAEDGAVRNHEKRVFVAGMHECDG